MTAFEGYELAFCLADPALLTAYLVNFVVGINCEINLASDKPQPPSPKCFTAPPLIETCVL